MAETTNIEWADATFNPWIGCTKLSAACDHCYAETWARQKGQSHLWTGDRRRTTTAYWRQPLKWNREAKEAGVRRRVFCASLADVFDNQVPDVWRHDLWELIAATPWLEWLLLTKRPQNWPVMLPVSIPGGVFTNIRLGVTIENQTEASRRGPILQFAHDVGWPTFVSHEPALGAIDWTPFLKGGAIDWMIMGGESGPAARPLYHALPRSVRDECAAATVPFFFKQWGDWLPENQQDSEGRFCCDAYTANRDRDVHYWDDHTESVRIGKKRAGRWLDGVLHAEFPDFAS